MGGKAFQKGNSMVKGLEVINDMTLWGMRRLVLLRSPEVRVGTEVKREQEKIVRAISGRDIDSIVKTMGKG